MENDYIILVDENGQPYIAHWGIQKGGQRANHKYIMRIVNGKGYRYFYTPEEVRAYQQALSGGARQTAENVANKARNFASRTGNRVRNTAQRTSNNIARNGRNTINQVRDRANRTTDYVKNEFKQAREANKGKKPSLTVTTTTTDKNGNKTVKTGKEAAKEAGRLVKEQVKQNIDEKYGHKIRNAKNDIEDAKSAVRDAGNKLKSTSDRMKDEFRKNKEAAADKVKTAVDNAKDEVSRVSKNVSYDLAKKDPKFKSVSDALKKAQDAYNNATFKGGNGSASAEAAARKLKEAKKQYQDLLDKYDTSSVTNKAKDAVKSAADNVQNKVTERANKAKDTYKELSDKAKNLAGGTERKAFDAAWEKVKNAKPGSEAQERALDAFEKARNAYLKTPMGKADYGTERAKEILSGADGSAKDIAKDLAGKAKNKVSDASDRMKDEFRKKKEEAEEKAKDAIDKIDKSSKKAPEAWEAYNRVHEMANNNKALANELAKLMSRYYEQSPINGKKELTTAQYLTALERLEKKYNK